MRAGIFASEKWKVRLFSFELKSILWMPESVSGMEVSPLAITSLKLYLKSIIMLRHLCL